MPPAIATPQTYQLLIQVERAIRIRIGQFGEYAFPAGHYCYTGSAKRNLEARIARHLRKEKKLRWHIDYLLAAPCVTVLDVRLSGAPECELNQSVKGEILIPGLGASDCRSGCGSHLKYQGAISA